MLGWASAQASMRLCPNLVCIDSEDFSHLSAKQFVRKTVGSMYGLNGWLWLQHLKSCWICTCASSFMLLEIAPHLLCRGPQH